jgi:hypothetical protein
VVYAGYAEAFWHRLTTTAASFGYLVAVERVGASVSSPRETTIGSRRDPTPTKPPL